MIQNDVLESTYGCREKGNERGEEERAVPVRLPLSSEVLRATLGALALKPMTSLLSQSALSVIVFWWVVVVGVKEIVGRLVIPDAMCHAVTV